MNQKTHKIDTANGDEYLMKRTLLIIVLALLTGSIATYAINFYLTKQVEFDLMTRVKNAEQDLSQTKQDLLGYTKYTDYIVTSKTALSEQMKFLAVKVDREYQIVEHIQEKKLLITSDATIVVRYAVEYSVGYDLQPDSFSISGSASDIVVTLKKPELVASPSVKIISNETASKGMLTDEKSATIALQQKLYDVAVRSGKAVKSEEPIIALCEKKLGEFLRDFISKQPGVKSVPAIKFKYS